MVLVSEEPRVINHRTSAPRGKRPPASGGYFVSLRLANVRCFGPEQTLSLEDHDGKPARWTVLLGDNGVGKTTLLRALAILAPIQTPSHVRARPLDGLRSEVAELVQKVRSRPVAQGSFAYGLPVRESIRTGQTDFTMAASLCQASSLEADDPSRSESEVVQVGLEVRTAIPPFPIFCAGYGASRRMGAGSLDAKDNPFATLVDDEATLRNAEEWLILVDYAANKESDRRKKQKAETELRRVKETLVSLLPDVNDIRVELNARPGGAPRVEVETPDGWVAIRDLSLGYRTTMAWVVDLAYRLFEAYPESQDPLAEPAVALVDEIDLHLHPKWQRDLMGHLARRFRNTQFITTAHSPLVVQAVPGANIAVLRREGDHVVIDQDLTSIRGFRVDQILTSDLFGLPTARDPAQDGLRGRREAILGKARLTKGDETELARIEAQLVEAPGGESPQQIEAMSVILRAAARLKRAHGA